MEQASNNEDVSNKEHDYSEDGSLIGTSDHQISKEQLRKDSSLVTHENGYHVSFPNKEMLQTKPSEMIDG